MIWVEWGPRRIRKQYIYLDKKRERERERKGDGKWGVGYRAELLMSTACIASGNSSRAVFARPLQNDTSCQPPPQRPKSQCQRKSHLVSDIEPHSLTLTPTHSHTSTASLLATEFPNFLFRD